MKKISELLLIIVIITTFSFIFLRVLSNSPGNNFFNDNLRRDFAKSPLLRTIFSLHFDGDAESDYLGKKYKEIIVEVDQMEGLNLSPTAESLLMTRMQEITGKKVSIIYSSTIPYKDMVSQEDLKNYSTLYRSYNSKDIASVYVLLLSQRGDLEYHLGSTFEEYGILLFDAPLKNFTYLYPQTYDLYLVSTALHEFGHQLGLDHNNELNCLMNETVEVSIRRPLLRDVITDFCDYEKRLIKSYK